MINLTRWLGSGEGTINLLGTETLGCGYYFVLHMHVRGWWLELSLKSRDITLRSHEVTDVRLGQGLLELYSV